MLYVQIRPHTQNLVECDSLSDSDLLHSLRDRFFFFCIILQMAYYKIVTFENIALL